MDFEKYKRVKGCITPYTEIENMIQAVGCINLAVGNPLLKFEPNQTADGCLISQRIMTFSLSQPSFLLSVFLLHFFLRTVNWISIFLFNPIPKIRSHPSLD